MEYYLFDNSITKSPIRLGHIDYGEFIWNCKELNKQYNLDFKQEDFERILKWLESKIDAGCYITNETIYSIFNIDSFKKIIYDSRKNVNVIDNDINRRILNIISTMESCLERIEKKLNKIQKSMR